MSGDSVSSILWYQSVLMGVPRGDGGKHKSSIDHDARSAEAWAERILSCVDHEESPDAHVEIYQVKRILYKDIKPKKA